MYRQFAFRQVATMPLLLTALSCSDEGAPQKNAAPEQRGEISSEPNPTATDAESPVTEIHKLVFDAFYDNNPVTYQPEPRDVTAARQKQARERIQALQPAQIQEIGKLLQHENGTVTECAAKALDLLGERAAVAVPDLIVALDLPGWEHKKARQNAIRVLGNLGAAALPAKDKLQQHLNHSESYERDAAKEALAKLVASDPSTPGGAIRPILLRMATPNLRKKMAAAQELQAQGKEKLVTDLIYLLQSDPDSTVRMMATATLGEVAPDAQEAVPVLQQALKDEDDSVRRKSAESLGKMGATAKGAVPSLIEAMQDVKTFDPSTYIKALGEIGPDAAEAVPLLVENLSSGKASNNFMLVDESINALGNIGPAAKDAVPVLIENLESARPHDQKRIAVALGKIGPAAVAAVPALQKAQSHFVVQEAAIEALRQIQPNQDPLVAGPADDPADKDKPADPEQAAARAQLFYEMVQQGDLSKVRALLTAKARPNYATGGIGAMTISVPDEAEVSVGKPQFKGDAAAVPVTTKVGAIEGKSHLFMRSEYGQWRVYAIRVRNEEGKPMMMNLEDTDSFMPDLFSGRAGTQSKGNPGQPAGEREPDTEPGVPVSTKAIKLEPGDAVKLGLSEDFPADLPLPAEASVTADFTKPGRPFVELSTAAPLDEVYPFYVAQLKANGWKILKGEVPDARGGQINAAKDDRTAYIGIHESKGHRSIKITELSTK